MIIKSNDKKALIEKRNNTIPYYQITNSNNIDIDTKGYNRELLPTGNRYKNLTISKYKMEKVKKEKNQKVSKEIIVKPLSTVLQEDIRLGVY